MDTKKITSWGIILFCLVAVLYPLWARFNTFGISMDLAALFPYFGLAAFSLLWLHSISGVLEPWMRPYINFDRFVQITATMIFWCIMLHPLLLLVALKFRLGDVFLIYGILYVYLGIIGWLLLITYDIWKPLKKVHPFFVNHWNKILAISNIGFLMTFFHSLNLGSDLQSGPLRIVWIFYGVTAFLSIIYTYFMKPWFKKV